VYSIFVLYFSKTLQLIELICFVMQVIISKIAIYVPW